MFSGACIVLNYTSSIQFDLLRGEEHKYCRNIKKVIIGLKTRKLIMEKP